MGPFEEAALELRHYGLAPLPLGGDDGKRPLVKFATWSCLPSENFLTTMVAKYPAANIGVVCGLSKITVLDVDDANDADQLLRRFGSTPLMVETPRGGWHGYYRNSGEGCFNLRGEGIHADVKGRGGIVVAPPSVRMSGEFAGRFYRIIEGSWTDLDRLPPIRPGALTDRGAKQGAKPRSGRNQTARSDGSEPPTAVARGQRNTWLFRRLLRHARGCDTLDELLDVARWQNQNFPEPLDDDEVFKTAASAWKYEEKGSNWCGGSARAVITRDEAAGFASNPDALLLLTLLRCSHGAKTGGQFAVSPRGMALAGTLPGWGPRRIARARDWLTAMGFVVEVHHGGAGNGDPSLFVLAG